ncbi:hypothetical protein [Brachybacterium tyrofermentans]|uniref:Asp23/Gls24 family envelope stress response protein n=1 Tax=Brachybacterium tyrofermentans TaxID=47848 RepID=A0ABW0FGI8_9MICO
MPDHDQPDHDQPHHDQHDPAPEDDAATARYLDLIRAVHTEWDELESAGDSSVQLSAGALSTIKESVRADARHGAHVHMPPTPAGPFTVSELTLRTLVRRTIDAVPDARALRTTFEYADTGPTGSSASSGSSGSTASFGSSARSRGLPTRASCRLSARLGTPDLPALADEVRAAVRLACETDLGLTDLTVDIHIEDLHAPRQSPAPREH